ncbi:unnamed protein product, partial [Brachionus calyciflorus]
METTNELNSIAIKLTQALDYKKKHQKQVDEDLRDYI